MCNGTSRAIDEYSSGDNRFLLKNFIITLTLADEAGCGAAVPFVVAE